MKYGHFIWQDRALVTSNFHLRAVPTYRWIENQSSQLFTVSRYQYGWSGRYRLLVNLFGKFICYRLKTRSSTATEKKNLSPKGGKYNLTKYGSVMYIFIQVSFTLLLCMYLFILTQRRDSSLFWLWTNDDGIGHVQAAWEIKSYLQDYAAYHFLSGDQLQLWRRSVADWTLYGYFYFYWWYASI